MIMSKTSIMIKQALFLTLFFVVSNIITGVNILGVPITFQTIIIFMIPFFFSLKDSIIWYLTLIIITLVGIPIMSGFRSGLVVLLGPSSGFIYGWLIEIVMISIAYQYIKNIWLRYSLIIISFILSLSLGGLVLGLYANINIMVSIVDCLIGFLPIEIAKFIFVLFLLKKIPSSFFHKEISNGM